LKLVREVRPDLILLDIMMPGMSGFDVCKALKSDKLTFDIPVLFITALSDQDSHRNAIESGGEGFIVKPFDVGLIKAYVRTFIRMKKVRDRIREQLSFWNEFMAMVVHDLNNLNFAVSANLELAMFEHLGSQTTKRYMEEALSVLKAG